MPFGRKPSRITGYVETPRREIAENFRRMLLRCHQGWHPDFEIVFWRKGAEVVCQVEDSENAVDFELALQIKRRATKMREDPYRLIRIKRKALQLTIAQAAALGEMPRSYWNMIELGQQKLTLASAQKIALTLDLPLKALIGE